MVAAREDVGRETAGRKGNHLPAGFNAKRRMTDMVALSGRLADSRRRT